jgi:spore germination cell wall hydrolase CwlJ-like protein
VTKTVALSAARIWREHPKELLLAGAATLACALALAGAAWSSPAAGNFPEADAPPAPPPLLVKQIAPQQALAVNQQIPLAQGPNPAAQPFSLSKVDAAARSRALECLTSAIYYEAGQESTEGQRAVAQVVLNRVRHPAFPATVCGVVYEGSTRPTGCQFTFTCDGSLFRQPSMDAWRHAHAVASAALNGYVYTPVGNATHYHANYVVPYWASTLSKSAVVGAHIFYRWAGNWGQPAAFAQRYLRSEPNVDALRSAAILAEQRDIATRGQSTQVAEAIEKIPGAEVKIVPSMRGDKRVAVRFNLTARKATDTVKHEEYVEKVKASDNLRWSLGGGLAASSEKPLGSPKQVAAETAAATAVTASGSQN